MLKLKIEINQEQTKFIISSKYDASLVQFMREEKGYHYNWKKKIRELAIDEVGVKKLTKLVSWLNENRKNQFQLDGDREKIRELTYKILQRRLERQKEERIYNATKKEEERLLDSKLKKNILKLPLFTFQEEGVKFIESTWGNCLIGDEMGLGKSCQAIAWMALKNKKALIICPKSLVYSWTAEIEKFTDKTYQVIKSKYSKNESFNENADFYIINYGLLRNVEINLDYEVIVLDESHYIKNHKALRSKEALKLSREAKHKILLSGTSIKNRPIEFWTQLNLLAPKIFDKWFFYAKRYCQAVRTKYGLDVSGASNLEELHTKIQGFYLRRNKEDVFDQMPEKIITDIKTPVTVFFEKKETALEIISDAKQRAAEKKVIFTIDLIKTMVEGDEKVVVFSDYVFPCTKVKETFKDQCIHLKQSDGSVARSEKIRQFQNDLNIKIFVTTIKLGGVGITLTESSKMIFNDLPWSPSDLEQAQDRIHRIGQKRTCNIYRIISNSKIDKVIVNQLDLKKRNVDKVLIGKAKEQKRDLTPIQMLRLELEREFGLKSVLN